MFVHVYSVLSSHDNFTAVQILGLSESKEAASSYGKGDVWALSATGRFLRGDGDSDDDDDGDDDVVFCR